MAQEGRENISPKPQSINLEHSEGAYGNQRKADIKTLENNQRLPVEIRKGLLEIKEQEVLKNAKLADPERVDTASKLLKRDLTPKEREGLLVAHNEGKGEVGKDGGKAGVYNYREGQLLRKAKILNEYGYSKEDRRILMEVGLVGDPIDRALFTDVTLQGIVDTYMDALTRAGGTGNKVNQAVLMNQMRRVQELLDNPASGTDRAQGQTLLNLLNTNYVLDYPDRSPRVSQGEEGMFFALTETDKETLDEDGVEAWVNQKLNILYEATKGQDASRHPLLQATENAFNDAIRYKQLDTEELRRLEEIFQTKERLIVMNSAFAVREMDQVIGQAAGLTAHRLLGAFNLDNGQVGVMFSRIAEKLESMRNKAERGHITPEMIRRVQDDLITEQLDLAIRGGVGTYAAFHRENSFDVHGAGRELAKAKIGKGLFGKMYLKFQAEDRNTAEGRTREAITRAEITRAIRASFDLFVSTQRLGVHMSRGKYLPGNPAFRSEPYSIFKIYNEEALEWLKYGQLTGKDLEMLRQSKLDLARDYFANTKKDERYDPEKMSEGDLEDVGTRLMRDLFKIPDVLSSGWRIEAILDQLDKLYVYKQDKGEEFDGKKVLAKDSENMGLFFRLSIAKDLGKKFAINNKRVGISESSYKRRTWGKIAQYRPEEIIRLFRERASDQLSTLYDAMSAVDPSLKLTPDEEKANLLDKEKVIERENTVFDKFNDKYGPIVNLLRNRALSKGKQLDTWNLSNEDLADVDKTLGIGEGRKLQEIYASMKTFIKETKIEDKYIHIPRNVIGALVEDDRFFDIYQRVLVVDDALLGELENPSDPKMVRLSETMGIDSSGDMLVRMMKDTGEAVKGAEILLKLLQTQNLQEKVKLSMQFADHTTYNGLGQRAKAVRFTAGTALNLAKSSLFWDVLGVQKAPFRQAISKYEEIYGPGVNPLSRDQLRSEVDQLGDYLTAAADNPINLSEEASLSDEKRAALRSDRLKEANKVKKELERITETTGGDLVKRRAYGLLLFLILAAFAEVYQVGKEQVKK